MPLRKLSIGSRIKQIPGVTLNELTGGELARRNKGEPRGESPRARLKSPDHVTLVWEGEEPLKPGSYVKLGEAAIDPTDDPAAPFSGLTFKCSAFEESDPDGTGYAITLGPIDAGDETPAVGDGILPEAWWALVDVSDEAHTHAKKPTTGTLLESGTSGLKILWKQSGTGEKWAVVQIAASISSKRFAIVTTEADAATGTTAGPVTPGVGAATLFTFGATLGANATAGDEIDFENYMRAAVVVNKPIFVFERASGIWVADAEGCEAYPTE